MAIKLVTGTFTSQVFYAGELLDVEWTQSARGAHIECDVHKCFHPHLQYDTAFLELLYRRSMQIEEAKNVKTNEAII